MEQREIHGHIWEELLMKDDTIKSQSKVIESQRISHSDLISREAVKAEATKFFGHCVIFENRIDKLPSVTHELTNIAFLPSVSAEPTFTEEVREALMRLTMCAREECGMCKYKDDCDFDKQYEMATKNMNTILNAFKCVSAERQGGWC